MDQLHNANRHRMAARGNATSFPLPWEDLLKQLQNANEMAELGKQIALPRTGTHLAEVVSILLKKRLRVTMQKPTSPNSSINVSSDAMSSWN